MVIGLAWKFDTIVSNKPSPGPSLPLSQWKAPLEVLRNNQGVGGGEGGSTGFENIQGGSVVFEDIPKYFINDID